MQTTANYLDMEVQDTLFKAAFTGIGASLGLAFAIMIVVSRDLLISALSIICVSGVVGESCLDLGDIRKACSTETQKTRHSDLVGHSRTALNCRSQLSDSQLLSSRAWPGWAGH